MNDSRPQHQWLTRRKVICVALLLLAAGYIAARPTLEEWLGMDLPSFVQQEDDNERDQDNRSQDRDETSTDNETWSENGFLKALSGDRFQSPEGLIYGPGPRGEHRIDHVMKHAKDIPDRDIHGVFDGDREQILGWIDEAYALFKEDSDRVRMSKETGKTELTVDMNKRVGYVGGIAGKNRDFPDCRRLKLVIDGNQVITAYPY